MIFVHVASCRVALHPTFGADACGEQERHAVSKEVKDRRTRWKNALLDGIRQRLGGFPSVGDCFELLGRHHCCSCLLVQSPERAQVLSVGYQIAAAVLDSATPLKDG